MNLQKITNKNYMDFISTVQPTEFIKTEKYELKNGLLVTTAIKPEIVRYPPMNADFSFRSSTGMTSSALLTLTTTGQQRRPIVPTEFNWQEKNKHLTPVQQQFQCGSCWAVSVATCIADKFVIQNLIDFNPEISYTYLMSCWVNEINKKCNGSNPFLALQYINEFGIGTDSITGATYEWCDQLTKSCGIAKRTESGQEYNSCLCSQANSINDEEMLSSLIPDCEKKNFKDPKNVKFFVTPPQWIPLTSDEAIKDSSKLQQKIDAFKRHIMTQGPVVGGFWVFKNLCNPPGGNFRCDDKNKSNIYLENVNYQTKRYELLDQSTLLGSHAVVIIGWGSGEVTEDLIQQGGRPDKRVNVPYWIVRNSWGKDWSDGGYFKMAMFPINRYAQFDTNIIFPNQPVFDAKLKKYVTEDVITGGMIMFEALYFGYGSPEDHHSVVETFVSSSVTPAPCASTNDATIYYFIYGLLFCTFILFILILCAQNRDDRKKLS